MQDLQLYEKTGTQGQDTYIVKAPTRAMALQLTTGGNAAQVWIYDGIGPVAASTALGGFQGLAAGVKGTLKGHMSVAANSTATIKPNVGETFNFAVGVYFHLEGTGSASYVGFYGAPGQTLA